MPGTVIVIEDDEDVRESIVMELDYESQVSREKIENLVRGISSLPFARNSHVMRLSSKTGNVLVQYRRGRKVKS